MEYQKNSEWELAIQSVTSEGNGVGKLDGYTVFVPDTAAGDLCRVKLLKCNKSYAYGKLLEVVSPSPDRREADCPVYPQCGGCVFRHIRYEAELRIKQEAVRDAFRRLGGIGAPVREILGSASQEGYRNKAQYPVGADREGKLISGFYARHSHRIVSCGRCALLPERFSEIRQEVLDFLREKKIPPYEESTGEGAVRHIYLRRGEVTGEILVCLVSAWEKLPGEKALAVRLRERFPEVAGVVLNYNSRRDNVILGDSCRTLAGEGVIRDVLCGIEVSLSPLSFYQVNHAQTEVLYRKAIEYASLGADSLLLDLYCGAGTIGLAAAKESGCRLLGVEIVPEAIENARENARRNGIEGARFLCADAGKAASLLEAEGVRPNVVIVDPPRKGLGEEVIGAILRMAPERIVMVSCNPATAARDAALFAGYRAEEITPVDLFPRTGHVEAVCLFSKLHAGQHIRSGA